MRRKNNLSLTCCHVLIDVNFKGRKLQITITSSFASYLPTVLTGKPPSLLALGQHNYQWSGVSPCFHRTAMLPAIRVAHKDTLGSKLYWPTGSGRWPATAKARCIPKPYNQRSKQIQKAAFTESGKGLYPSATAKRKTRFRPASSDKNSKQAHTKAAAVYLSNKPAIRHLPKKCKRSRRIGLVSAAPANHGSSCCQNKLSAITPPSQDSSASSGNLPAGSKEQRHSPETSISA